jgi:hypothetical protein
MAYYALLTGNIVSEVIAGRDEDDLVDGVTSWEDYYSKVTGQPCKRTSYNTQAGQHLAGGTPFRGNYAGIGYSYHEALDAFIPPKPEPTDEIADWGLNEETFNWEPVEA